MGNIRYKGDNYTRRAGSTPILIDKTITENGTYSASDDNADGYSEVTVDVEDSNVRILDPVSSSQSFIVNSSKDEQPCIEWSKLEIPDGYGSLQSRALYQFPVVELTLPSSLTYIDDHAIDECYQLERLYIYSELAHIGANICYNNENLYRIVFYNSQNSPYIKNLLPNMSSNSKPPILYTWSSMIPNLKTLLSKDYANRVIPIEYIGTSIDIFWNLLSQTPLIDTSGQYQLDSSNVVFDSTGAVFINSNSYLRVPHDIDGNYFPADKYSYEIEIGNYTMSASNTYRLFIYSFDVTSSGDRMFGITWFQNSWQFWDGSSGISISTDLNYFKDSTIKIELQRINLTTVHVSAYKDDSKIAETDCMFNLISNPESTYFSLGSHRNSCIGVSAKSLRLHLQWLP